MQLTIEIPDAQAERLITSGLDPSRAALEALAIQGYRSGRFFQEDLRRMLGFKIGYEVDMFLADHDVYWNYTLQDVQQDIEVADRNYNARQAALPANS